MTCIALTWTLIAGCKRLLWLVGFQFKVSSGADVFYVADNAEYIRALKVAVLSARHKAPALLPVIVVTGPEPAAQTKFFKWLLRQGAHVISHSLSFQGSMGALGDDSQWAFSQHILGSWLRVDMPHVLNSIMQKLSATESFQEAFVSVDREYVLWTDPDVIFQDKIDSCTLARPPVLSVGPELRMGWPENYGVIYFNISGYTEVFGDIMRFAKKRRFHFDHDQNLFLEFWGTNVTVLPSGMNWKPYWGNASMALPGPVEHGHITIIHTHGPKLSTAICFFGQLEADAQARRDFDAILALQQCGLKRSPNGSKKWLEELADILLAAYQKDGGYLYREMHEQYKNYLHPSSSLSLRLNRLSASSFA